MVGRATIIDAAISLMKSKTPQELSVLEIASAAGVDPALIRYYFTKAGNYRRDGGFGAAKTLATDFGAFSIWRAAFSPTVATPGSRGDCSDVLLW